MSERSSADTIAPAPHVPTHDSRIASEQKTVVPEDGTPISETNLRAGDLVEVDRNNVNCRAWMSITAPVRRQLIKGTRATLVSDPYPYGPHTWAKVRLHDDESNGCVATRYLTLIERPAAATDEPAGHALHALPADSVITITRLNLRSGPGLDYPVIHLLERGVVGAVIGDQVSDSTLDWLPVHFSPHTGWVSASYTGQFARVDRTIEVDLSTQWLSAWDGNDRVSGLRISTGKPGYSTPVGAFRITKKIPVSRLQGTVRGAQWDIPAVPWIMVFDQGGFDIHSAYWHNDFGQPVSHGCVTLAPDDAEWLYDWTPLGTPVWIHE